MFILYLIKYDISIYSRIEWYIILMHLWIYDGFFEIDTHEKDVTMLTFWNCIKDCKLNINKTPPNFKLVITQKNELFINKSFFL